MKKRDERLELLEYGPQYYQDGVTPLCDDKGTQLVLTTIKDMVAAQDNEALRVLKYSPIGVAWSGSKADNDYIFGTLFQCSSYEALKLCSGKNTVGRSTRNWSIRYVGVAEWPIGMN